MIKISEDKWIEAYKPLVNPVDASFGYDFGDGCTLVETYGDHITYLESIDENRIWTVIEDDNGNQIIVSGKMRLNRIGFIVTEHPWDEYTEVPIDTDVDD